MKERKSEILAPAGSMPDLQLMIDEGADAIYVGLQGFSSRPSQCDFTMEMMPEAVSRCHGAGVKLYIAINANVGQNDMDGLIRQILELDAMGVDAVILSEFGLIRHLSGRLKHAAMHASTLMGVYNTRTVRLLKSMGVTRIIFYANLYFPEMARIIRAVPDMEYELVAEGGTCFNDIRQCQIPHGMVDGKHTLYCRKLFSLTGDEALEGQTALPICEAPTRTAEIVGLFQSIGVYSFKIEGRTVPGPERVPMVRDLRRCIDAYAGMNAEACLHYFSRVYHGKNYDSTGLSDLQQ